jgi:FMN phosphatase YigB (HAD superfamily)
MEFLSRLGADPSFIKKGLITMKEPLPDHFVIPTTPNAKEILNFFAKDHVLALVTGGNPRFQLEKLEKAGIDRSIFSKIAIPEDSIKKPFYQRLIKEFSVSPRDVLVCGDRITVDLLPAFELGMTTVQMRWGRGMHLQKEKWVDHFISNLSELKRIVKV